MFNFRFEFSLTEVWSSCSAHLCNIFQDLSDTHFNNKKKKKGKEKDINSQQERKYDWHLGSAPLPPPPFFYLKIIAFVRTQDIGTFEAAIMSCNDIVIQLTFLSFRKSLGF